MGSGRQGRFEWFASGRGCRSFGLLFVTRAHACYEPRLVLRMWWVVWASECDGG